MSTGKKKRLGIIGYGQIGSFLYQEITRNPQLDLELAFVYEINEKLIESLPAQIIMKGLEDLPSKSPDLVVEAAHPDAVRQYAQLVLSHTDLMIMSVSALADADLERRIEEACLEHGTHLYIPHGGVLGLDGLQDGRDTWEDVTITMRKNPKNLDFQRAEGIKQEEITEETVLYDGPTRGVCHLYPKNVNSHATLALAVLGFDRTRSVLVADPTLNEASIEIDARGKGTEIHITKRTPIKGVTGKLTLLSVLESIKKILGDQAGIQVY